MRSCRLPVPLRPCKRKGKWHAADNWEWCARVMPMTGTCNVHTRKRQTAWKSKKHDLLQESGYEAVV